MASKYEQNRWELYSPNVPNEMQPHSFITKRKLEKMEKGIEDANVPLEVGDVKIGEDYDINITEDSESKTKRLNVTFPPAGKGDPGEDGKSAYEIWLEAGNIGTEQEFLDYLKGIDGKDGKDGKDGADGAQGPVGDSAYQIWISMGNTGSVEDFINSLKGQNGKSAYEIWLEAGNSGTEQDFIDSLTTSGTNGGKSVYDIWLELGNTGTPQDFIDSLKGDKGDSGIEGKILYTLDEVIANQEPGMLVDASVIKELYSIMQDLI